MKKYLIPLTVLVPVGILSYMYSLVSFLLLALIIFSLLVLVVVGLIKAFSNNLNQKWLNVPLTITAICTLGILIGLLRPLEPAIVSTGTVSEKLAHAYTTDQSDRMTIKTYLGIFDDNMAKRDSIRLEQVNQLYKDNQISQPLDKFYAAFVLHHSKRSELFEVAQQLANEAASVNELKDNYVAQWLAKATYDRWMVSLGKPQKYGTQDKFSISVE